jgi:hypothetical protein
MHSGYISFCDKMGLNIKSQETKERITNEMDTKFNIKIIRKHYDRMMPNSFHKLQKTPHLVCLRSNGNPYYLYLTRYQYVNQCLFIDKKVQSGYPLPRIIITKMRFADELYEDGTLLEGEMVKDMYGNWLFLIHDMIAFQGKYLDTENVVKRLNLLYNMLANQFYPDDSDVCTLQVKHYVPYDQLHNIIYTFMPQLSYTCRGLYFKPLYLTFLDTLYNFDDSLIKKVERIKYQAEKTFLLDKTGLLQDEEQLPRKAAHRASEVPAPAPPPPPPHSGSPHTTHSGGATSDAPQRPSTFLIEKTSQVDVYNVFDMRNKQLLGLAGVPNMNISRMLQETFKHVNFQTKLVMKCAYHTEFKKWVPKEVVNS